MSALPVHLEDPRMQDAIRELQSVILQRYPNTSFDLAYGDDPEGVRLIAHVDVDDPDEVFDLIVRRLVELQVEDDLSLYVLPVRTAERREALRSQHGRS